MCCVKRGLGGCCFLKYESLKAENSSFLQFLVELAISSFKNFIMSQLLLSSAASPTSHGTSASPPSHGASDPELSTQASSPDEIQGPLVLASALLLDAERRTDPLATRVSEVEAKLRDTERFLDEQQALANNVKSSPVNNPSPPSSDLKQRELRFVEEEDSSLEAGDARVVKAEEEIDRMIYELTEDRKKWQIRMGEREAKFMERIEELGRAREGRMGEEIKKLKSAVKDLEMGMEKLNLTTSSEDTKKNVTQV